MKKMFQRVRREDDLFIYETPIKTYVREEGGIEVRLACMDHIAREDYFLKMFDSMDSLEKILYECAGVGRLTKKQEESRANKVNNSYFRAMKDYASALGLSFQLDVLPREKYAENWEHCDVAMGEEIEQLAKKPEELDDFENQIRIMNKFVGRVKKDPEEKDFHLYMRAIVLFDKQRRGEAEEPVDDADVTIKYRNSIVKDRMKKLIEKEEKRFGVMYGLSHMLELSDFLEEQGFELKEEEWVEVWRVKDLQ